MPDIETIVGRQLMQPPLDVTVVSDAWCNWAFNDHPLEAIGLIIGRPERYADDLDLYSLGSTTDSAVDLGVEARWFPGQAGDQSQLIIRTKGHGIHIGINLERGDPRAIALEMARSILARLD